MKCPNEEFLQAYLDGELDREMRKAFTAHLEHCAGCRSRMEETKQLDRWVETALNEALAEPAPVDYAVNTETAWQQFEKRLAQHGASSTEQRRQKMMKKSYKKWMTGTAAAAVLIGALTIPQVQAAASNFLSIFRIDQVEMVKLTQSDLQEIENWMNAAPNGVKEIKGIGKIWVDEQTRQHGSRYFETAKEAQEAGYALPSAPQGYHISTVNVSPKFTLHAQLDTEKANALLKQVKADARFDEKLNNKPFALTVPQTMQFEFIAADKQEAKRTVHPSGELHYTIIGAPEIKVPEDVDLNKLRSTVLSLPFIPQNVKQQLAGIENWERTLPIPYVTDDKHRTHEVTVQGVKGFAYETEHQTFLIWQKDGKIHSLTAYDSKNEKHTDALISLANQMQ